jgi:hypothetical protein
MRRSVPPPVLSCNTPHRRVSHSDVGAEQDGSCNSSLRPVVQQHLSCLSYDVNSLGRPSAAGTGEQLTRLLHIGPGGKGI